MLWVKVKLLIKRLFKPKPVAKKPPVRRKKHNWVAFRILILPVLITSASLIYVYQTVFAGPGDPGTAYSNVTIAVTARPLWPTTPAAVPVRKVLTLRYISDTEIYINWTPPTGTTTTAIRAAYGHYPESATEGYSVYSGSGIEVYDTGVDLENSLENVYYTAFFQDAGGNWFDAIQNNIGGNGMTIFIQYVLVLGLVGLTFWRRDIFLYLITCPLSIIAGLQLYNTYHTSFSFVLGLVFIAVGIYSLYMGIYNIMQKGD